MHITHLSSAHPLSPQPEELFRGREESEKKLLCKDGSVVNAIGTSADENISDSTDLEMSHGVFLRRFPRLTNPSWRDSGAIIAVEHISTARVKGWPTKYVPLCFLGDTV